MRTTRTMVALLGLALATPLAAGCGGGVVQLTHEEYERLPRDSRQEIFDAENDLVIALNRQDEAEDKKTATEDARAALDARWKKTEGRLSSSGQGGKTSQAHKVYEANAAYLGASVEVATAAIDSTRAAVDVSRARLVLVRQRQAARIGRATLGSLKPLEEKVADTDAKLKAAIAAEEKLRATAEAQLEAWKSAEDAYAKSANDYDTGVWQ